VSSRPAIVRQAILAIALGCATTCCWFVRWSVFAQPPDASSISVYSAHTNYVVPLIDHNGTTYVGLVELLEPLGTVDAHADGKKYKLKFTPPGSREMELQFHDGKDKGKVKGENTKLASDFLIQNGRGYVPLSSISELLAHALSVQVRMNQAAGRLFVGDIGQRFTLELRPGNPSKLFVNFDSQVNPTIATGPGYIRFTFRREPVVPSIDHVSYNDPLITGAKFSEHDGIAELDVSGNSALMANFADAGRTIVVTGAPLPPAPPVAQQAAPPAATAPVGAPPPQPQAPAPPRFLVLIDPAHGGTEIGAAISPTLAEKDVVLALARRLQRELSARGISAALLRNSDVTIPLDQRAISANAARPALYISLHAANSGSGVHVFTSLLDQENYASRDFLPWNNAQSAYLDLSSVVAGSVAAELEGHKLSNILLAAPLRPMNNVAAPAIAVEIAPPAGDVADIASAAYQEQVAQSVAGGVAAIRSKIPEVRP
jgi:N-acetylmuramoyl-L-alanine amidase